MKKPETNVAKGGGQMSSEIKTYFTEWLKAYGEKVKQHQGEHWEEKAIEEVGKMKILQIFQTPTEIFAKYKHGNLEYKNLIMGVALYERDDNSRDFGLIEVDSSGKLNVFNACCDDFAGFQN